MDGEDGCSKFSNPDNPLASFKAYDIGQLHILSTKGVTIGLLEKKDLQSPSQRWSWLPGDWRLDLVAIDSPDFILNGQTY